MGIYHVRSTNGNTRLGGAKLVEILMRYCIEKLKENMQHTVEFNKEEMVIVRAACEKCKKELSTNNEVNIFFGENVIKLTRHDYEQLITPFVEKTMECVKIALEESDLEIDEIHKIALVGGGSFTPLIRGKLESFFKKQVNTEINPMEAGNFFKIFNLYYKYLRNQNFVNNIISIDFQLHMVHASRPQSWQKRLAHHQFMCVMLRP